jgi:hypothetical protein
MILNPTHQFSINTLGKFLQPVILTISIGLSWGTILADNSYARPRSIQQQRFVDFKYANEFKISHPQQWIIDPSGKNSNCHLYPTDSSVCTFAYMYGSKPNLSATAPLTNYIKTDVMMDFRPIDKIEKSKAKKMQIGRLLAYRSQSVTTEGDLGKMNVLTTVIAYKNSTIHLNTYFSDLKNMQLVKSVHDSFKILR